MSHTDSNDKFQILITLTATFLFVFIQHKYEQKLTVANQVKEKVHKILLIFFINI